MVVDTIHRFLGETSLGIAIIGFVFSLFARDLQGGMRRATVVFLRLFAIVLSIQWLLGIINYFMIDAAFRPSLMHGFIMTLAVALLHIVAGRARKKDGFGYASLIIMTGFLAVVMYFGIYKT